MEEIGKRYLSTVLSQFNRYSFIFLRTGGASSATNEEFRIDLRNMAMVFWKVMHTNTPDEGQFKEKFHEALEYRLEKVSH